ncbi:CHAT domain-containing protein [Nonomuraea sp. NPDC049725]|uniref:CHAT domain-containing protein n=1 Tax=Nonomuraea sp. NPDC049725 TaxID=3154508 RepID=UPI00341D9B0B
MTLADPLWWCCFGVAVAICVAERRRTRPRRRSRMPAWRRRAVRNKQALSALLVIAILAVVLLAFTPVLRPVADTAAGAVVLGALLGLLSFAGLTYLPVAATITYGPVLGDETLWAAVALPVVVAGALGELADWCMTSRGWSRDPGWRLERLRWATWSLRSRNEQRTADREQGRADRIARQRAILTVPPSRWGTFSRTLLWSLMILPGAVVVLVSAGALAGAVPSGLPPGFLMASLLGGWLAILVVAAFITVTSGDAPLAREALSVGAVAELALMAYLVAGPFGDWLASAWPRDGSPLWTMAVVGVYLLDSRAHRPIRTSVPAINAAYAVVMFPVGLLALTLSDRGLTLLLIGTLVHPHPGIVMAGLTLSMIYVFRAGLVMWRLPNPRVTIAQLRRSPELQRLKLWGSWLHTWESGLPQRRGMDLIRWLGIVPLQMSQGVPVHRRGAVHQQPGLSDQHMLPLFDLVEEGLELAGRVAERQPDTVQDVIFEAIRAERGWATLMHSQTLLALRRIEEAEILGAQAVELFDRTERRSAAALARVAHGLTLAELGRDGDALRLLRGVAEDTAIDPGVRELAARRGVPLAPPGADQASWLELAGSVQSPAAFKALLSEDEEPRGERYPPLTRHAILAVGRRILKRLRRSAADKTALYPTPFTAHLELLAGAREDASDGRTRRARRELRRALAWAKANGQRLAAAETGIELARLDRMVDPGNAYRLLSEARATLEELRADYLEPDARITQGRLLAEACAMTVDLLTAGVPGPARLWPSDPAAAALEVSELGRARVLLELLGDGVLSRASGHWAAAERRAIEAEAAARTKVSGTDGAARAAAIGAWRTALRELNEVWAGMERQSAAPELAEYAALRRGTPAGTSEIRALLTGSTTLLLAFHVTEGPVVTFGVTGAHDGVRVNRDPHSGLKARTPDQRPGQAPGTPKELASRFLAEARENYAGLPAPALRWSEPGDVICLVPHGPLHQVPLGALDIDLGDGVTGPLITRNPVVYLPSASALRHVRARTKPRTGGRAETRRAGAIVVADTMADAPVVHGRLQAADLAARFDARVLSGAEVTKERVLATIAEQGRLDLLHLACHGFFDSEEPLRSGVHLARGDLLTAADILDLRLDADLVTLAACDSGLGRHRPGDELIGLTRSLLYAGAASVLVTLWKVEEISTVLLLREFYARWASGTSKAEALRQAQLSLAALRPDRLISYHQQIRAELGSSDAGTRRQLDRGFADALLKARRFAEAYAAYEELLAAAAPDSPEALELTALLARSRRASRATPAPTGYRPYADPYYWAGFTLVGAWE